MPTTNRIIFNILARDIEETARFYEELCGLKRIYTSDWYLTLTPTGELDAMSYELGIIDQVHQSVPRAARGPFSGGYLTFVVDDVYAAHERAEAMGVDIVQLPTPMEYGQTQMVVRDPNGVVVDISTPISA
ncbi:VOC family protein [Pelagibacterium mangrovi]|uniref:VOC family protein n=1 Tax=Pelagibacterium mangrovi TaxID=3119828 RepID=UPI002FC940AC